MSDWIDAGNAGENNNATEKGCLISAIFIGILLVITFIVLPRIFS